MLVGGRLNQSWSVNLKGAKQGRYELSKESAPPVIAATHKLEKVEPDPLHGRFPVKIGGKDMVVEYEPDTDLSDTKQVPLLELGGIEAFFRREVLPHVPDAWIDPGATKTGYEISFTRYLVVYADNSKLNTKLDQSASKGYAVGFRELVHFVMSQLPQNEVIENALRKEVKLVPEIALRELVANALIHQDFRIGGTSIMIEIYCDRVEISNPGEPIVPVDRFIDGYQSRNERLADLMRRFAICEEKGSGVDKVIQAVELHQLPAPDFRAGFKRFSVVLLAPRSFESMDRNDRTRACYQHCCLCYVLHRKMTNQSLRERFNLPESKAESASRAIRDAMDAGRIRLADPAQTSLRFRSYVPFWA